mmetsp:Transcript_7278/g.22003  ORF Transcript_7278/g.22003 Transcript_7278/m.22003 type:complete len:352 (+) Transcript_7278:712-1767(+)
MARAVRPVAQQAHRALANSTPARLAKGAWVAAAQWVAAEAAGFAARHWQHRPRPLRPWQSPRRRLRVSKGAVKEAALHPAALCPALPVQPPEQRTARPTRPVAVVEMPVTNPAAPPVLTPARAAAIVAWLAGRPPPETLAARYQWLQSGTTLAVARATRAKPMWSVPTPRDLSPPCQGRLGRARCGHRPSVPAPHLAPPTQERHFAQLVLPLLLPAQAMHSASRSGLPSKGCQAQNPPHRLLQARRNRHSKQGRPTAARLLRLQRPMQSLQRSPPPPPRPCAARWPPSRAPSPRVPAAPPHPPACVPHRQRSFSQPQPCALPRPVHQCVAAGARLPRPAIAPPDAVRLSRP